MAAADHAVPAPLDTPSTDAQNRSRLSAAAFASLVGTTVEWYDFYLYVFCSALVFPKIFFPASDPVTAYVGSMGTLVVAFLARPIGALAFGHFGDTRGRKVALVVTLLAMGMVTFLIGLVPGYSSWGYWSVLALVFLRLLQGIFFGGEWGGAVLMTIENAPPRRRGWYGVFSQVGNPLGFFAASGVLQLIVVSTSPEAFLAWGWRIAFFASALLVLVGLWVRLRVTETRDFTNLARRATVREAFPLGLLFTRHLRPIVLCLLLQSGLTFGSYVLITYGAGYTQRVLGLPASWLFIAGMVAAAVNIPALLTLAWLSDRIGRKPIYAFRSVRLCLAAVRVLLASRLQNARRGDPREHAGLVPWSGRDDRRAIELPRRTVSHRGPLQRHLRVLSVGQRGDRHSGELHSGIHHESKFGTIYAVAAFGALGGVIGLLALIGLPETFRNQSTES